MFWDHIKDSLICSETKSVFRLPGMDRPNRNTTRENYFHQYHYLESNNKNYIKIISRPCILKVHGDKILSGDCNPDVPFYMAAHVVEED